MIGQKPHMSPPTVPSIDEEVSCNGHSHYLTSLADLNGRRRFVMFSFVGTDETFFLQAFRQAEPNAPSDVVLSNKIRFFGWTLRKMENLSIMAISQLSIWFVFWRKESCE